MKKKILAVCVILLALLLLAGFLFRKPLLRLYYICPYTEEIRAAAKEYSVPESLLCGVIWCESRFRPDAMSSYGACGLMQMLPDTFSEVLMRIGMDDAPDADIFSPEWNIRCGAFYLRYLYDYFENWDTALAAYNAGMGNVRNWLSDPRYSDDGVTLKEIPMSETKKYVPNVRSAQERYASLYWEES